MASLSSQSSRKIFSAHGDPIRIVPLQTAEAALTPTAEAATAPAAPPNLTYRHGPLLANVELFTLFRGPAWQTAQRTLVDELNQFFDFVLKSPWIDQLAEYSVPAYSIGRGQRTGTVTIVAPASKHSVAATAIQHMLQSEIAANSAVPQPTPDTLYFVYLPPGVRVIQGGSASCQAFCGYHNDISGQVFYAVMPFPGCHGCAGTLSTLDALTSTSSHELCEAITIRFPDGAGTTT